MDGCQDTRWSISNYCVYLCDNLVSFFAKRKHTISWSNVKDEHRGVANIVSKSCWIKNFILELCCPLTTSTLVYYDNVIVVYLSSNPIKYKHIKHIKMDIYFVREIFYRGQVWVLHVLSCYQIADIFTKELSIQLFDDFVIVSTFVNLLFRLRGCIMLLFY